MSDRCWKVVKQRLSLDRLFPVTKFHSAQVFRKACKALSLSNISPHVCRHTFASRMLSAGQPIQVVQKWLGHASIQMTVDRYGHLDVGTLRDSIVGVTKLIPPATNLVSSETSNTFAKPLEVVPPAGIGPAAHGLGIHCSIH
jgi:hypothetical protein